MSSSVKCDSAVMFGFIISLVLIFKGVVVITSAQPCSQFPQTSITYCHDKVEIKYPFSLYDLYNTSYYNYHCGYPGFGIKCVGDNTTSVMNISNQLYRPNNINYESRFVRVKELDIDGQECPHPIRNFSLQEFGSSLSYRYTWTLFYNCSHPTNNKDVEKYHLGCLDNSGRRSYAFPSSRSIPNGFNLYGNCEETLVVPASKFSHDNYSIDAAVGFDLYWSAPSADCKDCENSGGLCSYHTQGEFHKCSCGSDFSEEFDQTCPQKNGGSPGPSPLEAPSNQSVGVSPRVAPSNQQTLKPNHREKGVYTEVKVLIGVCTGVGVLLLLVLLIFRRTLFSIYKVFASYWRNKVKGRPMDVEMFLESCRNLTVQRYKYSDIKKMTNSFKETLGKGGYGSVFKGKLKHDGRLVAVKLLNESNGNGEDFINEVTTIGRTNHVNVVSLLGFCTEGTKRALVYEYMPNGSLEKFIYNEKTSTTPLGWEKLYQIALGIATGLEYLHRGCNTRILHFDIKPHNILLDEEFIPKISDFGLAKLCPTRESVVSMLVARGTIGYIAPEVYCRNFGGVSHKSDVYSYGMMVLEIIGGRKNNDSTVENMSEIYFPKWIYNHLEQGINLEGSKEIFEDQTSRKLILVALWCIQRQPADRPSISKVVEMLMGRTEELQMPPNPFEDFPSRFSS